MQGSVFDQTGAAISKAKIVLHNPVTGYSQSAISNDGGLFQLANIPHAGGNVMKVLGIIGVVLLVSSTATSAVMHRVEFF